MLNKPLTAEQLLDSGTVSNYEHSVIKNKVQVFISSKCGIPKYDELRLNIKKEIEATGLAQVYDFNDEPPSTLTAEDHYKSALRTSDVCIFLIDNADGIPEGVQAEIDIVKKHNIKSLNFFCDEKSKEETEYQKSITGSKYTKSRVIHRFDNFESECLDALIADIVKIYKNFCKGLLTSDSNELNIESNVHDYNGSSYSIPRAYVSNISKSKTYLYKLIFGDSPYETFEKGDNTNVLDDWGVKFLPVLFENKSITDFNTALFLQVFQHEQDSSFHNVIKLRWDAIQYYFLNKLQDCLDKLNEALKEAKLTKQPDWLISDILFDIRHLELIIMNQKGEYQELKSQEELTNSELCTTNPTIDKFESSLYALYTKDLSDGIFDSPYSIRLGFDYDSYISALTSYYIASLYNGSILQLILFYDQIKTFLLFLSRKFDDNQFKKRLLMFAIFTNDEKAVKSMQNIYHNTFNNLTSTEVVEILEFCNNHTLENKRTKSKLLAMQTLAYYLDDKDYENYEEQLINKINSICNENKQIHRISKSITECLSGMSLRMSQNTLGNICITLFETDSNVLTHYLLGLIHERVNLNEMNTEIAKRIIDNIISLFENDDKRNIIEHNANMLITLRNQNTSLTTILDEKIKLYMNSFYVNTYSLYTAEKTYAHYKEFICHCLSKIDYYNANQGKDGIFLGYGQSFPLLIASILERDDFKCTDRKLLDNIIKSVSQTVILSNESIHILQDSITLLILIVAKYPQCANDNIDIFNNIINNKKEISNIKCPLISSNIDTVVLSISVQLLEIALSKNNSRDFISLMSYIKDDVPTIISTSLILSNYLELGELLSIPDDTISVILSHTFVWLNHEDLQVRSYATIILLLIANNNFYCDIINNRVLDLIQNDGPQIKCIILRNAKQNKGLTESTKEKIYHYCKMDQCYIVRKVYNQVLG